MARSASWLPKKIFGMSSSSDFFYFVLHSFNRYFLPNQTWTKMTPATLDHIDMLHRVAHMTLPYASMFIIVKGAARSNLSVVRSLCVRRLQLHRSVGRSGSRSLPSWNCINKRGRTINVRRRRLTTLQPPTKRKNRRLRTYLCMYVVPGFGEEKRHSVLPLRLIDVNIVRRAAWGKRTNPASTSRAPSRRQLDLRM